MSSRRISEDSEGRANIFVDFQFSRTGNRGGQDVDRRFERETLEDYTQIQRCFFKRPTKGIIASPERCPQIRDQARGRYTTKIPSNIQNVAYETWRNQETSGLFAFSGADSAILKPVGSCYLHLRRMEAWECAWIIAPSMPSPKIINTNYHYQKNWSINFKEPKSLPKLTCKAGIDRCQFEIKIRQKLPSEVDTDTTNSKRHCSGWLGHPHNSCP